MPKRPFRVGRSITGLGLFATAEIKKRARIAEYRGRRITTEQAERLERGNRNRYMFELNSHWTIDGTPRYHLARYANHSCNPNAEPIIFRKRVFIRALRRIKPGEEITYHYGMDYLRNVIGISKCRCGRCRRRKAKKARARYARKKRIAKRN
jgi:SET domain-containing protein